jgi:tetratricopeptide (TPR) repeat protein/Zn-dependent protease
MWLVGIVVCLGWIFSLCLHEFSHAIVAYWGGDTSVKRKGYLTFNPLKYTNPGYSLILPLLFLFMGGIGLPGGAVYINQHRLRNRLWKSAVSGAGPVANILLALLLSIPFWIDAENISAIPDSSEQPLLLLSSLAFVVYLQVFAVIFNLLPIPGLDGYGIIELWLPKYIQTQGNYIKKYSTLIIVGLFWYAPWFNTLIFRIIRFITSEILSVPEFLVDDGSALFRQPINKAISFSILMIIGWGLNSPKNTWNQNQKGQNLIKQKQYQAAITMFDRSIEIDPDGEEAWSQKAYCLWHLDLEDRAIVCFQKVLEIDPDNDYARMSLGKIYFGREEYHKVISYLVRAVESNNQNISTYYYLGLSWLNLDEKTLANEMFDRAIKIEATDELSWSDKAECLWHLDLLDRAIICYQKVIKLNQNNTCARSNIGKILFGLEKYSEAIVYLEESIALDFESIDTYYYLGISLQRCQEYEQAEEVFDKALSLFPDNPSILHAKGALVHELKDYEVAIAIYQKLVEIEPENPTFWYDLACCYALHHNPELALAALQRSLELNSEEFKQHARTDLDFASLQDNQMFEKLIE